MQNGTQIVIWDLNDNLLLKGADVPTRTTLSVVGPK